MKLYRDLGIGHKAAWFMLHRLRKALEVEAGPFVGPVEVDETYMDGREVNKHANKKQRLWCGGVSKSIVVGGKDRTTSEVRAEVVEGTDAKTLQGFVADHAAPDATVYTDEAAAYKGMPFEHESVRHSAGECVKENGAHQRHGVLLGHAETGAQGQISQDQPQASGSLRAPVRGQAQCPRGRHDRQMQNVVAGRLGSG